MGFRAGAGFLDLQQRVSKSSAVVTAILMWGTVLWLTLCFSAAHAQSGAGSIQGTVVDPTGAVMPGASIHIVNQATGVVEDTKTNRAGFYQVPDLFTATYTITITAPGMKTFEQTIELLATQNAVIKATMTPGAVTETVEVTTDAVQLTDKEDGTISSTLDAARISQLPENTRELLTLAYATTPGFDVASSDAPSSTPGNGTSGQRANGLFSEALNYVSDGVTMTNRNFGGENNSGQGVLPDPDSIQQVTIKLTDASAQYATPGTAVITSKSGTNRIHGTAFETAVNNYWGVARTRNDLSGAPEPQYVRNEFGVAVGGPIVFPKLYDGRNKSFWFFSFERFSVASAPTEPIAVPTVAMRNGDFSNFVNSSGEFIMLFDPSTTAANTACPVPVVSSVAAFSGTISNSACRTQFPNNQIPVSREPAFTQTINAITPLPNNSNNPLVTPNLNAPNEYYVVVPSVTFRIDQNFNERNKAYLHYSSNEQVSRSLRNYGGNAPGTLAAPGIPAQASGYQDIPISNFGASLGFTHIFSSSFFSETILSNQWLRQYVGSGGNPNLDYEQELGLPNDFGQTGFPDIGGASLTNLGGSMFNYQSNQNISQIDENMTKTVGVHQMFFGGRYHHERLYYLNSREADEVGFGPYVTGLYDTSSGNVGGTYPTAGNGNGDFFLGGGAAFDEWLQAPPSHFRDQETDLYYQDYWHIAHNLTLNLGLRYEAHPARETENGANDGFDVKNHAIVLGNSIQNLENLGYTTPALVARMEDIGVNFETPAQAGFPSTLYNSAYFNFSPRIGFAWQFWQKFGTILRGGYGRYLYPEPTRSSNPGPTALPFTYEFQQNYENATEAPGAETGYLLRNPQSIFVGQNTTNVVNTSSTSGILPGFSGEEFFDVDYKPDTVTETNVTIEQPLKWNSVLRVSHVYSHGSYLDHEFDLNGHPSTFVYEMQNNQDTPAGTTIGSPTYGNTATGPYDQTVYGAINYDEKTGWSNDNQVQVNFQRLYHHGFGFQVFWTYSKAFRVGGNAGRDSVIYPWENYLGTLQNTNVTFTSPYGAVAQPRTPPSPPNGVASYYEWHQLDKWEEYQRDPAVNPQHIGFNYIVDLPFGRGKKFFGSSNRLVNEIIGGYQLAGLGTFISSIFQPTATNWGQTSPIQVYKHKVPITDCTSGNCYKEYLWFNGYIAPTVNGNLATCAKNCISGIPANYTAYQTPIDNTPGTTYYGTNEVQVNGSGLNGGGGGTENQVFASGPAGANPYSHTFMQGPKNWKSDISLFKTFPIKGAVNVRFNWDVFNFLNHQGYNLPNATTGIEEYQPGGLSGASSFWAGRQMQFTLRLNF
jgi:hypothetical protein